MKCVSDEIVEREIERLTALLVPYLCERTGLSGEQIIRVLDAQEEFWDHQPHVIGRMTILGFGVDNDGDELDG
jgi:hypothetical protein